jgi:hypothetical protein
MNTHAPTTALKAASRKHSSTPGLLYQPLVTEAASDGATGWTVPLCEAVAQGPCARSVPDDNSPDVESQCNKTGQSCGTSRCAQYGGHLNKGRICVGVVRHTGGINGNRICEAAGAVGAVAIVAKQALGPPGTAVTVACGVYEGVRLVKEILK